MITQEVHLLAPSGMPDWQGKVAITVGIVFNCTFMKQILNIDNW
jgi:hypothetical protein